MGSGRRILGVGLAGAGLAVLGVRLAGRSLRTRRDPDLDAELVPPTDVDHVRLETEDGAALHVVVAGEGPPVVLLHGITLQWWVWSAVIRRLRSDHRVIAWDMRGHGESRAGDRGVSLSATADDLAVVLERLDVRDAVIVGHSMGGMCLGRFAAAHRDLLRRRVRGLVFLATSAAPASVPGWRGGLAALAGSVSEHLERLVVSGERAAYAWPDNNLSTVLIRPVFGPGVTGRMLADVRRMLAEVAPRTLAEGWATIARHDVRRELAGVDVPTLVVTGEQDRLTPVAHARALAAVVPGSELRILAGVGHQVMQEDPGAVVDAVERLAVTFPSREVAP